jgi:glutamyl-tRNA reductase
MCLSTCNRVEVVYAVSEGDACDRRNEVFRVLTGRAPEGGEAITALRAWTGEAAVEHLLMVTCGLDSARAGEQDIFVQVRAAWQVAREAGTSGPLLDRILGEATSMARQAHRMRTHDAPSMADLAVERIAEALVSRAGPVALVGVSPMTRRCGLHLRERGVSLIVVNRSLITAQELAAELGSGTQVASLDAFRQRPVGGCVALVCATGASEPVLDRDMLALLAPDRPLLIDFGLPPNVDVEAAQNLGLERVGMDDLIRQARDGRVAHLMLLAPVRAAIDEHLERLRAELAARAIGPQLARLRSDFERITADEVDKLLNEVLPALDAGQRERIAVWGRTLAHRLAHLPLSGLRAVAEHAAPETAAVFFREARLRRGAAPGGADHSGSMGPAA